MSIRRQSTVHSVGAFPLGCNSQAKVTAWLQSSEDLDKCSKGETVDRRPDYWTSSDIPEQDLVTTK